MKKTTLVWSALVVWTVATACPADEVLTTPRRPVVIPKLVGEVKLDGVGSELQWNEAAVVNRFVPFRRWDKTPPVSTEVRLFTDGEHLYARYRCQDGGAAAARQALLNEHPDKPLPPEAGYDDVELLIDPQLGFPALMQARVNSDTTLLKEARLRGYDLGDRELPLRAVARADEHGWTVEMALPLEPLGLLGRWLEQDGGGFKIFFARNYRIPQPDGTTVRGAAVSGVRSTGQHWGFFDTAFYHVARFEARGAVRFRLGRHNIDDGWLNCGVDFGRGEPHRFRLTWPVVNPQTVVDGKLVEPLKLMTIEDNKSVDAAVMHQHPGLLRGRFVLPVSLYLDDRLVYRRPVLMELKGVQFWPNFPVVSDGPLLLELKGVQFRPNALVVSDGPAIRVVDVTVPKVNDLYTVRSARVVGPDGTSMKLPVVALVPNRQFTVRGFESAFRKLPAGNCRLEVQLAPARKDGKPVTETMHFVKGDASPPADVVIPNPGFEQVRLGGKPPYYWVQSSERHLVGRYPEVWNVAKQASAYQWADPQRTPQAVFAGERSVHLVSYGVGAQLHFMSGWFTIERDKLYTLSLAGRGHGQFVVRYYVQNDKREWLGNYFQCEPMELGRRWTVYDIPPVDFRVKVPTSWGGRPLKGGHDPVRAKLVVWPLNDAEMWLDNVNLRAVDRPR